MAVQTGTLLPRAQYRERRRFGRATLFDYTSRSNTSPTFEVRGLPLVLKVFDADTGQRVHVMSVFGTGKRERVQPFIHGGAAVTMDAGRNAIVLSTSGRYRLVLEGELGVTVTAEPQMMPSPHDEVPQPSAAHAHRPNLFFDGVDVNPVSKIIEVAELPWVFHAFGLGETDVIEVWSTYGWGASYREEPYQRDGATVTLTAASSNLTLDTSGRYRFKLQGSTEDTVLVGNPTMAKPAGTGEKGERGEPGPPGPGGGAYEHTQSTPSTEWVINHNLGYKPNVQTFTVGGQVFRGSVTHISNNQLVIGTVIPVAGTARLS